MKTFKVRNMVVTAVMSAVAAILMFLEFSVPIMPSFIKFDLSELPALIVSFAIGPFWGGAVCLIKNLIKFALGSYTAGIGELSNFLLGVFFVVPAGWIYKKHRSRKGALVGSLVGAAIMAVVSLPINYYITYPVYTAMMPVSEIVAAYQAIFGGVDGLFECLLVFNVPFNFLKGVINAVITFIVYKKLSPILKGKKL